jgi:hypothetical protein
MLLDADKELDARDRVAFVADMTAVVSSLFSEAKPSPVSEHLDSLEEATLGVVDGTAG